MSLNITKQQNESTLVVTLAGSLDTMTAQELEDSLETIPDEVTELVFDFTDLNYISSAGLRIMLTSYKRMAGKGHMKIRNLNPVLQEVFDVTGLSESIDIE